MYINIFYTFSDKSGIKPCEMSFLKGVQVKKSEIRLKSENSYPCVFLEHITNDSRAKVGKQSGNSCTKLYNDSM